MGQIFTYRTGADGLVIPAPPKGLFDALAALTARCSAPQGTGNALAAALSPELLSAWTEIPGARLQVCLAEEANIAFALYYLNDASLPDSVKGIAAAAQNIRPFAYAHLIVVDPEYRGRERNLYARLLEAAREELPPELTCVLCWVRLENELALRAHVAHGWVRTGAGEPMEIGGRAFPSEYLVRPLLWERDRILAELA